MKIRDGFVGNSSSSSFLAVVIRNADETILKALGASHLIDEGVAYGKSGIDEFEDIYVYAYEFRPDFIGMEIEDYLKKGKTLDECKDIFQMKLESKGITISKNLIDFDYGVVGSG